MLSEASLAAPRLLGLLGEEAGLRLAGLEHKATCILGPRLPMAVLD